MKLAGAADTIPGPSGGRGFATEHAGMFLTAHASRFVPLLLDVDQVDPQQPAERHARGQRVADADGQQPEQALTRGGHPAGHREEVPEHAHVGDGAAEADRLEQLTELDGRVLLEVKAAGLVIEVLRDVVRAVQEMSGAARSASTPTIVA